MEFRELINARRSVRGYAAGIGHDELAEILKEAQQAPSWHNSQTCRCYVAETREIIDELRFSSLPEHNQRKSENAVLVVTTYVKGVAGFIEGKAGNEIGDGWGAYDLGLHDAYFVLAAKNAGYDTLIMGMRDAQAIRERLGIPDDEEIMSVIAVGKPAVEPVVKPRKDLGEVVKYF